MAGGGGCIPPWIRLWWALPSFKISRHPAVSSAAVERLFSIEKDILKPKRCGLSDYYNHFEMLSFLKGNQLLVQLRLSYQNRSLLPFGFNIKMNHFRLNTHHGALGQFLKN